GSDTTCRSANDPASTDNCTLSLHDALPISVLHLRLQVLQGLRPHLHRQERGELELLAVVQLPEDLRDVIWLERTHQIEELAAVGVLAEQRLDLRNELRLFHRVLPLSQHG